MTHEERRQRRKLMADAVAGGDSVAIAATKFNVAPQTIRVACKENSADVGWYRRRVIYDLPRDIQMAIRLRAVKDGVTNGQVIARAIELAFWNELGQAKKECK